MRIAINGSNGFVGTFLCSFLRNEGYEVIEIDREIYNIPKKLEKILKECDGVINLAGASISKKWTKEYKKIMYDSRIDTTKNLIAAFKNMSQPPSWFISTSAVGIYANGQKHDESSTNYDDGFLGRLAKEWEEEALKAKEVNVRVSIFRFGVVLGDGGALSEMLPIFKMGLGGNLGDGKQGFSWIHIQDLVNAYDFVINSNKEGIFNITAPNPTTNAEFTQILGDVLSRPTLIKVPEFALKLKFGEGATVLLDGQKVYPKHLQEEGFTFQYPHVKEALKQIIK